MIGGECGLGVELNQHRPQSSSTGARAANSLFKLRGLRQGDPLSPFIFLLAAKGLGLLILKACAEGILSPALIGKNKISLSHLQYANDAVFVCNGRMENILSIKRILHLFELVSDLKVNFNKCKLFGVNLPSDELNMFADSLGCELEKGSFVYLGMQVGINSHIKETWSWLVQRVKNRIAKWDTDNISMGGRVTLIQLVLSPMPTYSLSFYLLPKAVIRDLIRVQRVFCGEKTPQILKFRG